MKRFCLLVARSHRSTKCSKGLWMVPLVVALAGCSADGGDPGDLSKAAADAIESSKGIVPGASSATAARHPCDVFTLDDAVSFFQVAADQVTAERSQVPGQSVCEYSWDLPDKRAIGERNTASIQKAMRSGGIGISRWKQEVYEPDEAKLMITFNDSGFKTQGDAVTAFDLMVERLTKGVGDQNFSISSTFDPIDDIGVKAAWGARLRQVSAVGGTQLYHTMLHSRMDVDADRGDAEAIARVIAAAL